MAIHQQLLQQKLSEKGLKATPQRIAILDAIYTLNNHPTAEQITDFVRAAHPTISIGTIYKTLDTFVKKNVIHKVSTPDEVMRYDGILTPHHHLYHTDSNVITDYVNEELDELLKTFFEKHAIEGYEINSVKLNIYGNSNEHPK
ncbi:MAG TPA: transcriptional repressor [Porphyromonadaceae bacterium]|jgi:Fur family peroxide stress response transcriptional regulator|uniref:Fur family transcriptional regulator n=1 Tax=Limibacterium fermenti TaxID=3229863 RepID=UPI000E8A1B38|nr:transcriptional repressor [Porphyromonadaceae bacterium]HBK32787.1 transcriptional repressor [Porphyromonadaceae bacterium]HBL34518.1 transcriptional repressor [Porphyromonadaceae bacterium]HBX19140.1 transcriptional repressor [Porphyromonadaceae bacterium]HBX46056.1 transcriptional repressor [Porphyromonadaceae bacterium]